MHKDMLLLLNAYMDGELQGNRLRELERHLPVAKPAGTNSRMRVVSGLLQAAPTPEFMPAGRFVSNLNLSLPRRTGRNYPRSRVPWPGGLYRLDRWRPGSSSRRYSH